jgi:hypothetical protein
MTPNKDHNVSSDPNLVRRTLRTVGLLVSACVIFVGVLSVLAVAITSRAVNAGGAQATDTPDPTKKPLSI